MTSTTMPVTWAAISWVVQPSQALTASGEAASMVVKKAFASMLRSIAMRDSFPWTRCTDTQLTF